jgi:hypothetical protein
MGHPAMFTVARTNCSTYWRGSSSSWSAGDRSVRRQGTFVFIPRGTVHAAKVIGTKPGKVLTAYVPGGLERSFEEFARLRAAQAEGASRSTDPQNMSAEQINEKYDSEFVGPPL